MDDPIKEIQQKIAYNIWEMRGGDSDGNFREAGKIIHHFLDRRPEDGSWVAEHEDYEMWEKYIYGREL